MCEGKRRCLPFPVVLPLLAVFCLTAACSRSAQVERTAQPALVSITPHDLSSLTDEFDRAADRTRLIVLLSPT